MCIPGWFFFTVAVAGHLFLLLLSHFKGTSMHLVFIPLPLAALALWVLHRPEVTIEDVGNEVIETDKQIVYECMLVRDSLGSLTEDPIDPHVSQCIETLLLPHMEDVVRALADHPELMDGVHVELQMALGDCKVRVDRVWTAIADHAYAEAHASLILAHTAAIRMCLIAERKDWS